MEQDINWDWLNESLLEPARFGGVFSVRPALHFILALPSRRTL
jgi:hypothetical protein